jgi:hypothetical protein
MRLHSLVVGAILGTAGFCPLLAEEVGTAPPMAPAAAPAAAPTAPAAEAAATELSDAELEKLVGRIALYPDPLIAQVLPASTYPLEIVMAARFVKGKEALAKSKPEEFQKEIEKQTWDASVKAVAVCPDALKVLNDDLDWTDKLGEAFLAQSKDVMDAVQTCRAKAQANGALRDTPQQTVMMDQETIRIYPSDPEVVYVPQYNPEVVYVQQPASSTVVIQDDDHHDDAVVAGVVGFGAGIAMGAWFANDCHWGGGYCYPHGYPAYGNAQFGQINASRNTTINNNFNRNNTMNQGKLEQKFGNLPDGGRVQGPRNNGPRASTLPAGGAGAGGGKWQHNPEHRRGQGYQNKGAFDKARQGGGGRLNDSGRNGWGNNRPSSGGVGQNRPSSGGGVGQGRPSAQPRPSTGMGQNRPSSGARPSTQPSRSSSGAFGNQGRGSSTRQQSNRGNQSMNRSSGGGGSRGGGGGGSRGGGGGGGGRR